MQKLKIVKKMQLFAIINSEFVKSSPCFSYSFNSSHIVTAKDNIQDIAADFK